MSASDGMREGWDGSRSDATCERRRYTFANGYGASVVRGRFDSAPGALLAMVFRGDAATYGAEKGLWELGVLGPNGHLCYDTPITDDVLGSLTVADVNATLAQIEALPPAVAEVDGAS